MKNVLDIFSLATDSEILDVHPWADHGYFLHREIKTFQLRRRKDLFPVYKVRIDNEIGLVNVETEEEWQAVLKGMAP